MSVRAALERILVYPARRVFSDLDLRKDRIYQLKVSDILNAVVGIDGRGIPRPLTIPGMGNFRTITGTNPAAGAEVLETVPAGVLWRLLSFSVVLVTDATVANRVCTLVIDDGTTANRRLIRRVNDGDPVVASQTRTLLLSPGFGNIKTDADRDTDTVEVSHSDSLPEMFLSEAYRMRTVTSGIVAGDNYAAPIFQVEEFDIGRVVAP